MKDHRRSFLLPPPNQTFGAGAGFLRHARFRLMQDYIVKIQSVIAPLDYEQIWRRPNAASNSIGNLLLHLEGNLRQWIVAGVGAKEDRRDRTGEFASTGGVQKSELLAAMLAAVEEADAVLAVVEEKVEREGDESELGRLIEPQGYTQTVLDAIFHAVEHFSYHTGQIVLLAKWLRGEGVGLYDDGELAQKGPRR
jgi:uncharacterized damage-inducible protein DinB